MIEYTELVPVPILVGACFDEKAFVAELKRLGVDAGPDHWSADAAAALHLLDGSDGSTTALMCFDAASARARGMDGIQIAALLCHEAVHVMQECRRWMREKKPGSEWEAFTVQFVAQEFMNAYLQWVAR